MLINECSLKDTTVLRNLILENLCDEYENLSGEEYEKMIDKKVEETEFVKAIIIYVG